jgi:hypothetical protein
MVCVVWLLFHDFPGCGLSFRPRLLSDLAGSRRILPLSCLVAARKRQAYNAKLMGPQGGRTSTSNGAAHRPNFYSSAGGGFSNFHRPSSAGHGTHG